MLLDFPIVHLLVAVIMNMHVTKHVCQAPFLEAGIKPGKRLESN